MIKTEVKTGYVIVFSDNKLFTDTIYSTENRALSVVKKELQENENLIAYFERNKMDKSVANTKIYVEQLKGLKVLKVNKKVSYEVIG